MRSCIPDQNDKKKPKTEGVPSPEHLRWVIDSRAANQRTSADLYELLLHEPKSGEKMEGQLLVAIAFSLWRAAFLAYREGDLESRAKHAESLLLRVLADNAIGYAQEVQCREATYSYYLDNARLRLEDLGKHYPKVAAMELTPPKGKRTARNRCMRERPPVCIV